MKMALQMGGGAFTKRDQIRKMVLQMGGGLLLRETK